MDDRSWNDAASHIKHMRRTSNTANALSPASCRDMERWDTRTLNDYTHAHCKIQHALMVTVHRGPFTEKTFFARGGDRITGRYSISGGSIDFQIKFLGALSVGDVRIGTIPSLLPSQKHYLKVYKFTSTVPSLTVNSEP
ncbi:MAG: hypothetical protein V1736_04945 [Pseudomonadota bacterium]